MKTKMKASPNWTCKSHDVCSMLVLFQCLECSRSDDIFDSSSLFITDGRAVSGHRAAEDSSGSHDGVHEIRVQSATGSKPAGQCLLFI